MLERNASISERSTSASRRSSPDALSTSPAADPACAEAVETPTLLLETSEVPPAACWMLRAISRVAAPCSSTAAAIAVVAGARGFNGGVEREQVGLRCDNLDQVDHDADAAGVLGETLHGRVGLAGFIDSLAGNFRRRDDLTADFRNRRRQFFGARGYRLHVDRGFLGGGRHRAHQRGIDRRSPTSVAPWSAS